MSLTAPRKSVPTTIRNNDTTTSPPPLSLAAEIPAAIIPGTPRSGAIRSNFDRLFRISTKAAIATATLDASRTMLTP